MQRANAPSDHHGFLPPMAASELIAPMLAAMIPSTRP